MISKLLKQFRIERTKTNFQFIEKFIDVKEYCRLCKDSIYYEKSMIRQSKQNGKPYYDLNYPSCLSFKIVEGHKYFLTVCENCLIERQPRYLLINKAKAFNTLNEISCFAYEIPLKIKDTANKKAVPTLANLVRKHGENEGKIKWDRYRELQAITNTFEYKREKYGWNREKFDNFNKSRSITKLNLIHRHGKKEGERIFNSYVEKQRFNGKNLDWFIQKHGEEIGRRVFLQMNLKKSIGSENSSYTSISNVSQIFFEKLDIYLNKKFTTYFHEKNLEKKIIIDETCSIYYLDYYIDELNICIEFFGDFYHANPRIYKDSQKILIFKGKKKLVSEIWEKDSQRIENLRTFRNIKTIIVWEGDYYKNKDNPSFYQKIVSQCLK